MRHALLVSHYFPPRFTIGGKRAYRFARYLPEHGWSTTVLTSPPPAGERLDTSFAPESLASCRVVSELLTREEVDGMPRVALGSDGTIAEPSRRWASRPASPIARLRAELRFRPPVGANASLVPRMARRIARLARQTGAEVVFVTGAPWEPVVAGVLGARAARLPVIVDFRDPWSFGPLAERAPLWLRTVDRLIERAVLRRASALTVTSDVTRDAYVERAGGTRVVCIRTGFDEPASLTPRPSGRTTLVHFGNCYGERSLATFLRALARVQKAGHDVRLLNLGRVLQEDLELAASLGVSAAFEHTTVLPYDEGLAIVAGADLGLVPSFGEGTWFLPGKLYDYWAARTPVLAATRSPEIRRLVLETRTGFVVDPDDVEAVARRIEEAVEARRAGSKLVEPDEARLRALSARSTAAELARLFGEVAALTPGRTRS